MISAATLRAVDPVNDFDPGTGPVGGWGGVMTGVNLYGLNDRARSRS
jgi:hypothetical protein